VSLRGARFKFELAIFSEPWRQNFVLLMSETHKNDRNLDRNLRHNGPTIEGKGQKAKANASRV